MDYGLILNEAHEAGMEAGNAKVPTPMVVTQHENMGDDSSPVEKSYYVPQGVCGFAWVVTNEHGNGKFVKYLKSVGEARKCYYGGFYVVRAPFGQCYEKKVAYANAYAAVLNNYNLNAYADSRLD